MDDKKLEAMLSEAKAEADRFFNRWEFESCQHSINFGVQKDDFKKGLSLLKWGKLGLTLACLFLGLLLPSQLRQANQVLPQVITLDERQPAQLVDFVPLTNPEHDKQGLLALLWGVSQEGQYEVVYSSIFNDSVFPRPVDTLDLPGTPYRMALISSEDNEQKYLHYRLIGYTDRNINTILAEDYVLGGKVGIGEGKMVEERGDGLVTHIVPYQIDEQGQLILSAERVQLQVGEQLLLIGLNLAQQVKFFSRKDVLQQINETDGQSFTPQVRFTASSIGEDRLQLTPIFDSTKSKTLYITVVK